MFSPAVHAGRMDQWTVCGMLLMYFGPQDLHATWTDQRAHPPGVSSK